MLRAFALIAALAFLGAMSPLEPPSPSRGETRQPEQTQSQSPAQQAAADQRGTDQVPLTVKVLPTEKSADERAREQRERDEKASHERWLTNWTGVLAIFTIFLVLVAGIQAGFFWIQLKLMRKGVDDARKAADAAMESAEATKASVELAKETAERQLRAYVYVRPDDIHLNGQLGGVIQLQAGFKAINAGQTPAFRAQIRYAIKRLPLNLPAGTTFDPFFTAPEGPISEITIAPGPENFFGALAEGTLSGDLGAMIRGGDRVYVVGVVTYFDVFNIKRTTEFCYFITNLDTVIQALAAGRKIKAEVGMSDQHNKAT